MPSLVDGIQLFKELGFFTLAVGILVAAATYGLLAKIKVFGDNKGINMTISIITAFIVISAFRAVDFIILFIQYMTVIGTILLFLIIIFLFAGVKESTIAETMNQPIAYGAVIVGVVIVLFIVASQAIPEIGKVSEGGELASQSITNKALESLFHPTVLAIIVLFAVFIVTVYMITRTPDD